MGNDSANAPCRPARSADFEGNLMTNLYEREDAYIPRVAAIHDLCGYGKCSLGVAIPVLSAAGCDVCPVPTGLFSSHTAFPGWYMHDTTDILGDYLAAWAGIGVELDAVYSGFLGAPEQVDIIKQVWETYPKALRVVDPVMADHGKVYPTYTPELVEAMGTLANGADILTPNLTEAAIILGREWQGADVDEPTVREMILELRERGAKNVVLKGIEHGDGLIHNYVWGDAIDFTETTNAKLPYMLHGTGDVFASTLLAAVMAGRDLAEATAFATKHILDHMRDNGVRIDRLIGVGGIAQKSPFVMQLLADTTGMRIDVSDCKQAGAMGAVVHAATIAGLYPSVTEAQQALCAPASRSYVPDVSRQAVLNERYARYRAVGAFTERLKNNR